MKILKLMIVMIMSIGIVGYTIILPNYREIKKIIQYIESEKRDLELKYQKGQLMKKVRENFKEIEQNSGSLNEIFFKKGKELDFINRLEQIADSYILKLDLNLESEAIPLSGNILSYPLKMKIEGDYIQILKFLNELEIQKFYFNIRKIDFQKDMSREGYVNATIQGKMYGKILPAHDNNPNKLENIKPDTNIYEKGISY